MKEHLLHYIWQFQLFKPNPTLATEQGELLTVFHPGHYLQMSGPDFFNAQLSIGTQMWAGNVEIHIKASDWYAHHHETDRAYDNVILHVVWESDIPVFRADQSLIPVLILKDVVAPDLLKRYQQLFDRKRWIACEDQKVALDPIKALNWKEGLYVERLKLKTAPILELASETKQHWEQLFFVCMAKGFGLNANGDFFEKWSKELPIEIVLKYADNLLALEALFLGGNGLLSEDVEDQYGQSLRNEWLFLKHKYQLKESLKGTVQFFKLRPDNFPTIRLVQLAAWYHANSNGAHLVLKAKNIEDFYKLFDVGVSAYWQTHFVFDKESKQQAKKLSKKFVDLLILNTVIPYLHVYFSSKQVDFSDRLFDLVRGLKPESNQVISNYIDLGFVVEDALDSQALLQLKKHYCDRKRCLECLMGRTILYT